MQTYCTQSKREILCSIVHVRAFRIIKEIKVEMRFLHEGLQLKLWVTQINSIIPDNKFLIIRKPLTQTIVFWTFLYLWWLGTQDIVSPFLQMQQHHSLSSARCSTHVLTGFLKFFKHFISKLSFIKF